MLKPLSMFVALCLVSSPAEAQIERPCKEIIQQEKRLEDSLRSGNRTQQRAAFLSMYSLAPQIVIDAAKRFFNEQPTEALKSALKTLREARCREDV